MKYIIIFLFTMLIFSSCSIDEEEILDLNIKAGEIVKIELRADHKTLLPNGIAKMQFHTLVYAKRKVTSINREEEDEGEFYTKEIDTVFLVPQDQVPVGLIKVYDQDGNELKDNTYATTKETPGTVRRFYARYNSIESNHLDVTIRELPDESYPELVVPVVFHVLVPPATSGPSYEVSVAYLEEQLQRVSDVFNRRITTDPNGGNAKVTFKLAAYGPNGAKLQEPGKNIENISQTNYDAMGTSSTKTSQYLDYILKYGNRLIWNPNRYLNIWLARFYGSTSTTGGASYRANYPTVMHSDYDLNSIPGLEDLVHMDRFTLDDVEDCREVGIMVNIRDFLVPDAGMGRNEFALATPIAEYYGVLQTRCDYYDYLNEDGDSDYCPDTYAYDYGFYPSVYKGNNLDGQPENEPARPLEYFTSFNVMDIYSRKTSLSVDQVKRVRMVMEQCPSRWSYKSDWAFTGHE